MKKSLVLAMAMALGVTASAYAANPFSDVPAGHWAYDSVAKLAAAGVVDGYADGAFDGDKLMTRYEMAQIVAKAMAKGANVDKLAAEFADELDTLGVRVAKLEKGADAVKISGHVRYSYDSYDVDGSKTNGNSLRNRLYIKGAVNDDWTYTAMIQNTHKFDNDTAEEDDVNFQRAYLTGKLGGLDVTAGRYNMYLANGALYDHRADAIEVSYGKDVKVTAFYGKPTDMDSEISYDTGVTGGAGILEMEYGETYGAYAQTKLGVLDAQVGYTVYKDGSMTRDRVTDGKADGNPSDHDLDDNKVWNVALGMDIAKDLNLTANYLKSDFDSMKWVDAPYTVAELDDEGYMVTLSYKGAKASAPGSYGVYANWYDQGRGTVMAHTMNGYYGETGFEGWMIGANYAVAKNIVAAIEYYDLESKGIKGLVEKEDMETLWAELVFTF
ncbi:MAG: S-layer homology domain-containing protein [Acidaminococcaceae bacterium]|nr:S-layer homology domain-containing protein [Acidaminococcaceae bacterium]